MDAREHVTMIGVLNLVFSGMGIVLSLLVLLAVALGMAEGGLPEVGTIALVVGSSFVVLLQIPGILVGIGLLARKEWARKVGLLLAAFYLMLIPFGTIFGIYAIYMLERPHVRALFQRNAPPPVPGAPTHVDPAAR